jgi:flagellar biosynthesis anti-sigma factor FlgM
MRIDLNAKTPELPESQGSNQPGSSKRASAAAIKLPADEATLATHARVQELQSHVQQMPEDRQAKVEALMRAIRDGKYNVGAEQIAHAMFAEMAARSALF